MDSCPWGCCRAAALAVVTNDPRASLFSICLFIKLHLFQWILCTGAKVQGTRLWMGARHESPSPPGAGWKYFRGSWIFPDCFTGPDVLCSHECAWVAVPDGCRGAGQLESPSKEGIEQGGKGSEGMATAFQACHMQAATLLSFSPACMWPLLENYNQFYHSGINNYYSWTKKRVLLMSSLHSCDFEDAVWHCVLRLSVSLLQSLTL